MWWEVWWRSGGEIMARGCLARKETKKQEREETSAQAMKERNNGRSKET
jgi:hypothetical protein